MEVMKELTERIRKRPMELQRLRNEGKKIVACLPGDFIPLEIIHAAGAESFHLIFGGETTAIDASTHAVSRHMCPFSRAQYGYYKLKDESPFYDLFDLLIVPTSCIQLVQTGKLYEYYTDIPVFNLGLPQPTDGDRSRRYLKEGFQLLQSKIEKITGINVDEKKLSESISLYRRIRELLKDISESRKLISPPIKASEFILLNQAVLLLSPEVALDFLYAALEEIKGRTIEKVKDPRILVVGPNVAMGDNKIIEIIESSGGRVVVEDFAEGVMFYWENVKENGDQFDVLVDKYLMRRPNCAFIRGATGRHLDFVDNLVKQFSVDGVIWYQLKLCETYNMESYYMAEYFRNADPAIPFLKLESEYDSADISQIKIRVETFLQTINKPF